VITQILADGRPIDRIAHQLTDVEAYAVRAQLADEGIRVAFGQDIDSVLHIYALDPVDTRAEVRALAAVGRVTDARLAFHQAVTP
jgi:hypothetical protein